MQRSRLTTIFVLLVIEAALVYSVLCVHGQNRTDQSRTVENHKTVTKDLTNINAAIAKLKPLFPPKAKSEKGEWLAEHKEAGQTFNQYIAGNPTRPTKMRTTIYVQPLGTFNKTEQKLLDETADLLGRFYNVPVKSLEVLPLVVVPPDSRRKNPDTGKEQLLTTYILQRILPALRPEDAMCVLALTNTDLWPGERWNFVFGQASLTERVGVWSTARYGDPTESDEALQKCRLRMFKVAIHETGHMFGIQHCTAYECGMNGSNHLKEADRNPLCFCPECSAKIWWASDVEPAAWYKRLSEFAKKHDLKDEATLWEKSLKAIEKSGMEK